MKNSVIAVAIFSALTSVSMAQDIREQILAKGGYKQKATLSDVEMKALMAAVPEFYKYYSSFDGRIITVLDSVNEIIVGFDDPNPNPNCYGNCGLGHINIVISKNDFKVLRVGIPK